MKFFKCDTCGKVVMAVVETAVPTMCCGKPMEEIVPGTVDASLEKHVPVFEVKDNVVYVTVGAVIHPMEEKHFIEWISLQTNAGNQRKVLKPGTEPKAAFAICEGETVEAVYAYCNLHGLWKA